MVEIANGRPAPDLMQQARSEQADKFAFGFQYAIENIAKDIGADGTIVLSEAVIIALAMKLGERIGMIQDRNTRRVALGRTDAIIRQVIARRAEGN
jgi:hypothetical protein